MVISILGTKYKIIRKKYTKDPVFKNRRIDGYCDSFLKEIVVCDLSTVPEWEYESDETIAIAEKNILRHEIVHAFLNESGLAESACQSPAAWPHNEEMVDWIALQGQKIYEAWKAADAL